MARTATGTGFIVVLLLLGTGAALAASVDPELAQQIESAPLALTPTVITFDHQPISEDLAALQALGIMRGVVLNRLPIVLTEINKTQFDALRSRPDVVSLYLNKLMELHTNVSRTFIGVTALRKDRELTKLNGGLPVSGKGVGVAIVDTGIDGTHPDVQFGKNVVQNVFFPLTELSTFPTNCPRIVGLPGASFDFGFVGPVFKEDTPFTDAEGGHGTFVSGVAGGTGQASGGFYGGTAPGANLIGLVAGNDCGLPLFGILQAFDYILVQKLAGNRYDIRVVNNSWGSTLGTSTYDPNSPINVATRKLHDANITVVFSAGNSGNAKGAINRHCVAPWVICVAASVKEGLGDPATFSSRGVDNGGNPDVAGMPADPNAPPNLRPDLTAPGVDIKSTRSKGPGVTNVAGTALGNDLSTIAPAFLPFYTTSQGTSFSAPHVTGVVALMMEVNPLLTPDDVVTILRSTATPMPYEERVVGAGYLDAHNAVRAALGLTAVPHPANLFPPPGTPEIQDPEDDQLGTQAQDIREGNFSYDAATNQIVYRLTLADLSTTTTNMRWTMQSDFGATTVFVATNITETGARTFQYGTITVQNNVRTQQTLGAPDSGEIVGNDVVIRLGLNKVNAAVGSDVLGTTSTATAANAWLRIGSTLTPSLLLNADSGSGRDFKVEPDGGGGGGGGGGTTEPFCERFAGMLDPAQSPVEVSVTIKLPFLDAKLNYHPGGEDIMFELYDSHGHVATADQTHGKRILIGNLNPGEYMFRLSGTTKAVDYVINSCQSPTAE